MAEVNFITDNVKIEELSRIDNRVLTQIKIMGKRTGFVETRLNTDGVPLLQFALGNDMRKAKKTFASCIDRRQPIAVTSEDVCRARPNQQRQVRRQSKPARSVRQIELQTGDTVVGCVDRTFSEKGFSFFKIVGRCFEGRTVGFPADRQPTLFVHDRQVPKKLINDLDETSNQTYTIEVKDGKEGKLEGVVIELDETVQLSVTEIDEPAAQKAA